MKTVIQEIAARIVAIRNCASSGNVEWERKHGDVIKHIEREHLPSGSGFDSGCTVDVDRSFPAGKVMPFIEIDAPYHAMNEHGYYIGWVDLRIRVRPVFDGIDLRITAQHDFPPEDEYDTEGLVEYAEELFMQVLTEPYEEVE